MAVVRNATITWHGTTARGSGVLAAQSGALDGLGVDLPTRGGDPEGKTSPEELLAAAHATCYAMSLVPTLVRAGTPPEKTEVVCEITMDMDADKRFRISRSVLTVSAEVPDADEKGLEAAAQAAHALCGFSRLLVDSGADVEITTRLSSGARTAAT